MTGKLNGAAASWARRKASRSLAPATVSDSRALTPTTTSRCRAIAPRARATLAALRLFSSPPGATPVRAILMSKRPVCGAPRATAAMASTLSAPADPASTQPVTPSERQGRALLGAGRVGVDVDEAWRDDLATRVDRFGCVRRYIGLNRRDP